MATARNFKTPVGHVLFFGFFQKNQTPFSLSIKSQIDTILYRQTFTKFSPAMWMFRFYFLCLLIPAIQPIRVPAVENIAIVGLSSENSTLLQNKSCEECLSGGFEHICCQLFSKPNLPNLSDRSTPLPSITHQWRQTDISQWYCTK